MNQLHLKPFAEIALALSDEEIVNPLRRPRTEMLDENP
jgi:hypothetical protein